MPACNNFCTTSSSSSSSHVSHFTAITFSSKKKKENYASFRVRESFHLEHLHERYFCLSRSVIQLYLSLVCETFFVYFFLSFSSRYTPENLCFFGVFFLSLSFLILFYVRMYVCYMLNQFHIDDDGRNINKRKKLNDIDSQRFSFYLFFCRVHNESNRTSL